MLAGASHDTAACPFPAIAVTPVGAPGPAIGVTAVEAAEAAELPTPLVATTLKVYAVPLVRPVTSQLPDAPVATQLSALSKLYESLLIMN